MQLGDARKLEQGTQEALRHRAVLLVEKGATHMEAAQAVGVHRGTVSRWYGAFRRNGASGIEKGRRGRRVGDQLMLTQVEARRVQGWIASKCPNVAIFIDFLKRLIKDAKQKVFLIVDNLRVHHAKSVREWLAQHKDKIEIFYLPAYAPEHNPDEYLNNDLKQTIKNKPRAKTRDDLVATTSSILKSIQKRPDRVRSYFHAKHVRYAA